MTATVAIAGSSGLIGSALVTALRTADHHVLRIVRRAPANADELHWDPDSGEFDAGALSGVDAVVNLCGINIGRRRWSGAFKQNLRDSRITPTEVLSAAVADAGVGVLINASAVGYYGDTKDRAVDETASAGTGFLAQLCADWEAVTAPAARCRRAGGAGPHRRGAGRRRAARCASCGRCSRWASAPDWATAASTCPGSASRTRCGRCSSRSPTSDCPGR